MHESLQVFYIKNISKKKKKELKIYNFSKKCKCYLFNKNKIKIKNLRGSFLFSITNYYQLFYLFKI